jgi:hypothetical protein
LQRSDSLQEASDCQNQKNPHIAPGSRDNWEYGRLSLSQTENG